jgi:hypothetical protein
MSINQYPDGVRTTEANDVPSEYSKMMGSSEVFHTVKGTLNKYRVRPRIQNEHAASSREAMDVVDASTVVGQMFRASNSTINGISLTLESAAVFASMDAITAGGGEHKAGTMEYSSDAALQAEYIKSGAVEAVRSAFTDDGGTTQDGSYACKMPCDAEESWTVTLTSTDLTGVTFSLKYANTKEWNKCKVYFFIGDGTNTKSYPLTVLDKNDWQTFTFEETAMNVTADDLTVTTPTMTAITRMGFRVTDTDADEFIYADSITYQAEPGSVAMELWDMGTSLPASNGTVNYTTAGTQYTELGDRGINGAVVASLSLTLEGGKRKYLVNRFIAGTALENPDNTILNVDNYYAIVLKYVDTDVTVYGPNTLYSVNYYTSGYGWKAEIADNLIDVIPGAAGAGAYSDIMFQIFSTQDVYITKMELWPDAAPGNNAEVSVFSEDSNMMITDIALYAQRGGTSVTSLVKDLSLKPIFLECGGKFEAYHNDDPQDDIEHALFVFEYLFIPPTVHG